MIDPVKLPSGPQMPLHSRAPARPRPAAGAGDSSDVLPNSPPPEVLDTLGAAARALEDLADRRVTLRFEVNEASGRIEVEVVDAHGRVIRHIPPGEAAALLSAGNASAFVADGD